MIANPRRTSAVMLVLSLVAAGCVGTPTPTSTPTSTPSGPSTSPSAASRTASASGEVISGRFEVDGRSAFLECKGTGSPTVILETGLGGDSSSWVGAVGALMPTTRTCRYDRAGLGSSEAHPGDVDLSVGDRAVALHGLLSVAGVEGPYVLVGFSYGGMLIRAFADRYPTETSGLVFVDGAHEEQFVPGGWWIEIMPPWTDGAHDVDLARSRDELLAADTLADRPIIVLTQGEMNGELERQWSPLQDAIAGMSSTSLHMVATESRHDIRADRPELVIESIRAVVETVRGKAFPACGPRFETLGAECLAGTMGDLLAAWDALRAAVVPTAGDLPEGTYAFGEDDVTFTVTIDDGRLEIEMRHADGLVESTTAEYAAVGDEVTFLWPLDWRIPRTSGVNTARWTVDPDGTLHFVQLDAEQTESWIAAPWTPTSGADAE